MSNVYRGLEGALCQYALHKWLRTTIHEFRTSVVHTYAAQTRHFVNPRHMNTYEGLALLLLLL